MFVNERLFVWRCSAIIQDNPTSSKERVSGNWAQLQGEAGYTIGVPGHGLSMVSTGAVLRQWLWGRSERTEYICRLTDALIQSDIEEQLCLSAFLNGMSTYLLLTATFGDCPNTLKRQATANTLDLFPAYFYTKAGS